MDFSAAKDYIVTRLITELPKDLYYHGAHHTFDVVKSIYSISKAEGVSQRDFIVLLTAAYYHDAGYLYKYHHNEDIGVKLVQENLPEMDYSPEDIQVISDIIMATSSHIEPQTHLEKIMCDADHDYFGRHDYRKIAVSLRKELAIYEGEYSDEEWVKMQLGYLSTKHKYYTETAINTRLPNKENRIQLLKEELMSKV